MYYSLSVVTSSLTDNENVVIAALVKLNDVKTALIVLKENEIFSKELNERIKKLKHVVQVNKTFAETLRVVQINLTKVFATYNKNIHAISQEQRIDQIVKLIQSNVFKSITAVDVIIKDVNNANVVQEIKITDNLDPNEKSDVTYDANKKLDELANIEDEGDVEEIEQEDQEDVVEKALEEAEQVKKEVKELDAIEEAKE